MISLETKDLVAAATVRFTERSGLGVLIEGGFIVTAAHVLKWDSEGGMALGNDTKYVQEIEVGGRWLSVYPFAIDPLSDIAICGAVDGQWLPDEAEAFEDFCEVTRPLRLDTREFPVGEKISAYVLTHTPGRWITGDVTQWQPQAQLLVMETLDRIEGGTSGGPIVTENGLLLGVVSYSGHSESDPGCHCALPRPHLCAPFWLAQQMLLPASSKTKLEDDA
jgi:S1-C subfamily serine protease